MALLFLQQIGMPMGYDNNAAIALATADGLASFYDYSQADRRRIVKPTAPVFLLLQLKQNYYWQKQDKEDG